MDNSINSRLENHSPPNFAPTIVHKSFWVIQLSRIFRDLQLTLIELGFAWDTLDKTKRITSVTRTNPFYKTIQRSMAEPLFTTRTCLPRSLLVSIKLRQHAEHLKHFLDTLPAAPFRWRMPRNLKLLRIKQRKGWSLIVTRISTPSSTPKI